MQKRVIYILVLAMVLCLFAGCKKDSGRLSQNLPTIPMATEPEMVIPTAQEVEAQLRLEAYPEDSSLMTLVGQGVRFSDFTITEETVTFTLTAPYFGDALIAWYDSVDSFDENDLEDQVANNQKYESVSTEFTLSYTRQGGQLLFGYTEEYLNAAGCGIREYYNHIYSAVLEEMGVGQ